MTTGLLITTAGQAAITADLSGGTDLVLTHVAFGDASGVPYPPNVAQTALVNERYRSSIASVAVVDGAIVIDAIIPADTPDGSSRPSHGFNIAEAGIYSNAGTLIGVARMGNGYKPPPSSGQAAIATFRFKLAVANPSAITVVIDPQAQIILGRHVRAPWITVEGVLNDPPGSPALGATYVIGASPTGAWTGFAHRLAQWVGVWSLSNVPTGHQVVDNSKGRYAGDRWLERTASGWDSGLPRQIQSGAYNYAVATGTANAWTVATALAVDAYAAGRVLNIIAPATNTSTTVNANISTLGNRRIKKRDGSDPAIGDIIGGAAYPSLDDGTNIRILTALPSEIRLTSNPVNLSVVNFDASGSWTVPAGVFFAFIEAWGAGGGGGAGDGSTDGGLGGGGGLYAARYVAVTPGDVHTVTIGVGGGTSTAPGNAGAGGGSTSLGALITAGGGGAGAAAGGSPGAGGASSAGAQIVVPGGGAFVKMAAGIGTPGGNAPRGAQGGQQGNSGQQPGGGAAGNSFNNIYSGQKGGNGRVTITFATP